MKNRVAQMGPLLLVLVAGCQSTASNGPKTSAGASKDFDAVYAQSMLEGFNDEVSLQVRSASATLVEKSPDSATIRATLRWKLSVVPTCRHIVDRRTPEPAFLDLWALMAQMTYAFDQGDDKDAFGANQSVALEASRGLEASIERVGANFFTSEQLADIKRDVDGFASTHPVGEYFTSTMRRSGDRDVVGDTVKSILNAPLHAINPFGGVDKTAQAIHEVSVVGDRFAELADRMPEELRWQAQLLLLDAAEADPVKPALVDLQSLSASVASLAQTASTLPADVGEQVTAVLGQLDEKQAGLQATLKETQATLASADQALDRATSLGETFDKVAASLTQTGAAWQGAFHELDLVVNGPPVDPSVPPKPPPPADQPYVKPFEMTDVGDAADKLTVTLRELHAVVGDVRAMIEPEELDGLLKAVDSSTSATVDFVALRVAGLILLTLLAAIAYRWAARRMAA